MITQYLQKEFVGDSQIKNDVINKINDFILTVDMFFKPEKGSCKIHSITSLGHDSDRTYWKTILFEIKVETGTSFQNLYEYLSKNNAI